MGIVFQEHSEWVAPLMRDMAMYFARFKISEPATNAYCRLLGSLIAANAERDVLFSSLNYELLLELAATVMGRRVNYSTYPPPAGELSIVKVHGSCNFLPHASGVGSSLALSPGFVFETGGFNPVGSAGAVAEYLAREPALYPIMCLYMPGKGTHMGPQAMRQIQASWREHVLAASKVILIGVRPNEGDRHLWDSIADTAADVYHVGADVEIATWSEMRRSENPSRHLGTRFEDSVNEVVAELIDPSSREG